MYSANVKRHRVPVHVVSVAASGGSEVFAPLPSSLFLFSIYHENMEYHSREFLLVRTSQANQNKASPSSAVLKVGIPPASSTQHVSPPQYVQLPRMP